MRYVAKGPIFRQADRCAVTHRVHEQMAEKISKITWKLHRTLAGTWIVSSSVPEFSSINRNIVENWLILHGCAYQDEVERLFKDADEKGEGLMVRRARGS